MLYRYWSVAVAAVIYRYRSMAGLVWVEVEVMTTKASRTREKVTLGCIVVHIAT